MLSPFAFQQAPSPSGAPSGARGGSSGGSPKAGSPKAKSPKSGSPKAGSPRAGSISPPKPGSPKLASAATKARSPKSGSPKASSPQAASPQAVPPTSDTPKVTEDPLTKLEQQELLPELFGVLHDLQSGKVLAKDFDDHLGSIRLQLTNIKQYLREIDGITEDIQFRETKITLLESNNAKKLQLLNDLKAKIETKISNA